MKSVAVLFGILIVLLNASYFSADAQNFRQMREEIEQQQAFTQKQIENLQEQIDQAQQEISEKDDAYEELYQEYQNTRREVTLRQSLIENKQEERRQLEAEQEVLQSSINQLREDLDHLIEQYKKTLTYVYKHGRTSNLAMILSAGSINQMVVRARYLSEFEDHRKRQARQIEEKQAELRQDEQELERAREQVAENIRATEAEQERFEQVMLEQEEQIAALQEDRQRLQQQKNASEMEAMELENTLTELVEEEMALREARLEELEEERERRRADAENLRGNETPRESSPSADASLPDEAQLEQITSSFKDRKGNLPWPVNSGTISEKFGDRENPLYGTRTYNPGVQIATSPRNEVKAVHDGYVFAIRPMPGYGNTVFVNHGDYNTVYGNLSEVKVSMNTVLQEGDIIGKSGDEQTLNGQVVFFMISEGSDQHFDPEEWMSNQ